jgi:hypothetical protein
MGSRPVQAISPGREVRRVIFLEKEYLIEYFDPVIPGRIFFPLSTLEQ